MAATREESRVEAAGSLPESLYRKLSPGPGRSRGEVALHQRTRLFGAMVEIVGARGYEAVTVRELARLAGVSTRTFYQHFDGKEECFLRTLDFVVHRAAGRIAASQKGEHDWRERLRLTFLAFGSEIERKPYAARLALVESLTAGPAALEEVRRAESTFEAMIAKSITCAPNEGGVPPLLIEGIAAGVASVARTRLLAGNESELPALGSELMEWALSYRCETATEFELLTPHPVDDSGEEIWAHNAREGQVLGDDRARILSAAAKLAAVDGYRQLTVPRIRTEAGVSRRSFDAHFDDARDCFLAALELRVDRAFQHAFGQAVVGESMASNVYRMLLKLTTYIAHDRVLAKLAFVEVFASGLEGVLQRERVLAKVTGFIRSRSPVVHPHQLTAEFCAGALWGLLERDVASGRAQQLPSFVPMLAFLVSAPAIGASAATEAIREETVVVKHRTRKLDRSVDGSDPGYVAPSARQAANRNYYREELTK